MRQRFSKQHLRFLRNAIPIETVIVAMLNLPVRRERNLLRFACPCCAGFDTATNGKTNLARCFACRRNFNTIDLVMAAKEVSFLNAVSVLEQWKAKPKAATHLRSTRDILFAVAAAALEGRRP